MKKIRRDKSIWGYNTHMHGNSTRKLCSYLYLKQAKMLCCSFSLFSFSSTKSENRRAEQVLPLGRDGTTGKVEALGNGCSSVNMAQKNVYT
jgi:hypothetical protein